MNSNNKQLIILFLTCLMYSSLAISGPVAGVWNSTPIFPQKPLEIKLGVFNQDNNPDALAVILWNDGSNNRLDAVRIPPPYDGTGITSTSLENTATLFALGDICTTANSVLVPYIKNFNLEVARFDGNSWSMSTVPGTTVNNFDNADCMQSSNGVFLATHDLTDSETELFSITNGGMPYTFYGRYNNVSGPFDGASREPLASTFGNRYIMGLNQTPTGMMRATRIDTNSTPPIITHTNIRQLPAPTGFTHVKESAARLISDPFFIDDEFGVTYNADGNARIASIPVNNPTAFTERNLGSVNNNGSQFTFQGSTLVHIEGDISENNVLWGDFFIYDTTPSSPVNIDSNYPLMGVGGPVDGCRVDSTNGVSEVFIAGSRVGSVGTDLHIKQLTTPAIFADGFESGDTSSWSQCE